MTILTTLETAAEDTLSAFLVNFVTDDLGKLAVAAVNEVETLVETSDVAKRDAAKTALLNAAEAAGKDLASESESVLNFLIETALQVVTTGVAASL